jgi:SPOR domain
VKVIYFIFFAAWFVGCTASKPIVINRNTTTPTPQPTVSDSYDEDLSVVRPRYNEVIIATISEKKVEVNSTNAPKNTAVTKQVEAIMDTMSVRNRALRYAMGYRIQIYVGNARADADAARLYTYQTFPELNPYMNYTAPTYRIRIGDFMNRYDAERYLQQLKGQFPMSSIQAEKIEIRKSILVK